MPRAHWFNTALYRLQGFSGIEGFGANEIATSVCMHLQYTEQIPIAATLIAQFTAYVMVGSTLVSVGGKYCLVTSHVLIEVQGAGL